MTSTYVYDSDERRRPFISEMQSIWRYRGLLRLLVTRDLTVRYKRSVLGVWWTLLNPLLTMAVMWVVFSRFFRFKLDNPNLPFVVYLFSGILLVTFFSQGVIATGSSIVNSASVLSKVYVPAEIFALSAAISSAFNFFIGVCLLLIIQIAVGVGVPLTVFLIVIPTFCLLLLVIGLGLLLASAAVHFFDVLDLSGVIIQLLGYLTPTFYPVSMLEEYKIFVYVNPLYSYLAVFRAYVYEGVMPPAWNMIVMVGTSVVLFVLGIWVFGRSWRRLVVLL